VRCLGEGKSCRGYDTQHRPGCVAAMGSIVAGRCVHVV
jgi:hypothetical protein